MLGCWQEKSNHLSVFTWDPWGAPGRSFTLALKAQKICSTPKDLDLTAFPENRLNCEIDFPQNKSEVISHAPILPNICSEAAGILKQGD